MPPEFSIVIPTKNRPAYLAQSVYSALHQDFRNVEVIVSDNFNDAETYAALQPFLSDTRLKYIRTDREMNMIDHWEWCTRQATGRYVVVLPDRKLIYRKGLIQLHRILTATGREVNAASFGVNLYDETAKKMGWNAPIGDTRWFAADAMIENFLHENYFGPQSLDSFFPKTLNGCYRNAYAADIRERYGRYFNLPGVTTPDYSSLMVNLALNENVLYAGAAVFLTQGEQISNGRNFGVGKFEAYMQSLGLDDPYARVPIKAPFIYNLLINDYLVIQEKIGGRLQQHPMDTANLLATTAVELNRKIQQGMLLPDAEHYFRSAWENALANQPGDVQQKANALRQRYLSPPPPNTKKLSQVPLHIRDFINHRFSHIRWIGKMTGYRFDNALQAAGYNHK